MRHVTGFVAFVLGGAVLAGGCSARVTGPTPGPGAPLRVSVSQNPTVVGGMAVFSVRVENISDSVVNLTFPSSCQVLPYFRDRAGRAVTPVGGGFVCLTVLTNQTLRPGASFGQTFTVKPGTSPESQYVVLPPGEYQVRGRLEDSVYKLESDPVPFAVQ
jgi:hypothetical protein